VSKEPSFAEAVAHKVYYGPVYFRRESEPYMTLSLAGTRRDNVEHAVGDEREADYSDEQRNVFDEQPAAHDRGAGGRSDAAQAGRQPANASGAMIRQRCHAIVRQRSRPAKQAN
jgi:hypothetical protein